MKQRALVIDERTQDARYFILVETEYGGRSSGNVRFNHRDGADQVCRAINAQYEREGRLWEGPVWHDD